jgi:hypothetical protein
MMQTYLKETDIYSTSDLPLAAALCCCGYQIEAINKQNPSKAIFLIKRGRQLDDLVNSYFAHQLQVDPLMFFNFLKEIKNRIYNA